MDLTKNREMVKTAKEMTSDILSSLRDENNPLGVLIESYIEKCIKDHVRAAKDELIKDELKKIER